MLTLRLLLLVLVSAGFASAQSKERPNLIWLVAEDMSPWLGCYGDTTVPTPNCDRLAREGIRYANAFATSPVCAPARSSLITGMYATRIGTMQMPRFFHLFAALNVSIACAARPSPVRIRGQGSTPHRAQGGKHTPPGARRLPPTQ